MTRQAQAHTPGPIFPDYEPYGDSENGIVGYEPSGQFWAGTPQNGRPFPMSREPNAKLLAAAYTSYDKHCGPRAVECAEADLLGEALAAIRAVAPYLKMLSDEGYIAESDREAARAVLAKASGAGP